ncbi:acyclic terpene utilization AtuA family protein [Sphingobium sp. Cam5-1]|uniref:acyclic terpene utilization AtuA family protein n=1 Tax=Sphingobium sp. Cam5-1 TaxID=2789327 RepID=UPI0018AD1408|nr:acyclic terpene utilization AtuA family protein [Sphingobium sp. Cam5-1]QPI75046.1 DUF1446 domain-containing protein [Sphingobium sp. Cam5-1]
MKIVRIGAGAGFSGDRIDPAVELAEKGDIEYLVFECLAERTIALAQQARRLDPEGGFDPLLDQRFEAVLQTCVRRGIKIITNMGAANPKAAAARVAEIARSRQLYGLKIAAVTGDDVLEELRRHDATLLDSRDRASSLGDAIFSANAYTGAGPIVDALAKGADIVITGRVADPALFLGPMIYEFGWAMDDWEKLGRGTAIGHLLECGGQVSGGYFADPGKKEVADLARLGFPIAEVNEQGDAVITKVPGSGGRVGVDTCTEQLLYEVHDPKKYLQPDVTADFSHIELNDVGPDRVAVTGAGGTQRPDMLKTSIGYLDGYIGEGQISYAGPNALARGRLALQILEERFRLRKIDATETRFELIGVDSILSGRGTEILEPKEVRVRAVGRTRTLAEAERIGREVEGLYTAGPAAGGGAQRYVREVMAIKSALVPRDWVRPAIAIEVS